MSKVKLSSSVSCLGIIKPDTPVKIEYLPKKHYSGINLLNLRESACHDIQQRRVAETSGIGMLEIVCIRGLKCVKVCRVGYQTAQHTCAN